MKWKKIISREYSVQYCQMALLALSKRVRQFLPVCTEFSFIIPEHNNQCFYVEENEFQLLMEGIVEKYTSSKEKFVEFQNSFHNLGKEYVDFCREVNEQDLIGKSNAELKEFYVEYQRRLLVYSCVGAWIGHLLSEYWTDKGKELLDRRGIKEDKVRKTLFRPSKKSTVLVMQEEARKIKENGMNDKEIENFHSKYSWIQCLDVHKTPWSLEEVKDYISNIREIGNYDANGRLRFSDAVVRSGLSAKEVEMFVMIKELGYIKDARDDYRRQGIFLIQKLFREIAVRMKIGIKEIAYLSEKEIVGFLNGKEIDVSRGRERKREGFMLYLKEEKGEEESKEVVLVEENFEQVMKEQGFVIEEEIKKEIRGTVACQGKVRGKVVIVRTIHDILKVEKGDILVAVVTHPDYVPAMQKAAAIVTDEGGMLSHAAIVSREMGIPCIVGTGNATKVLDYGIEVEVDAIEGIVKVIER